MSFIRATTRDIFREQKFFEAYGIRSKISAESHNDQNWDWEKVILKFDDEYELTEHFKKGADNSTDHVVLSQRGIELSRFPLFIEAELALVSLLKKEK